jgi:protein O-GlcNAc transferase
VHQQRREWDEAARCITRAIALDSSKAVYHNNLGVVLRSRGRLAEAEAAFRQALRINARYPDAHSNLGAVLHDRGRHGEALAQFGQALQLQPAHADALYNLGNLHQDQGRSKEAIACYEQAMALRPQRADIANNLGNALLAERRYAEASASYQQAIRQDPACAEAYLNLGVALGEQGRIDEAARCCEQAARLRPERRLWKLRAAGLCPVIFPSTQELDRYRRELAARLDGEAAEPPDVDWRELATEGFAPSFQLCHQGRNNRPLMARLAALFAPCFPPPALSECGDLSPLSFSQPAGIIEAVKRPTRSWQEIPAYGNPKRRQVAALRKHPFSRAKPRIGFLVTRHREGGFLRDMAGIVEHLDRTRFDVVMLCSQTNVATCQAAMRNGKTEWVPLPDRLGPAADQIAAVRCDLVYHWQIGTDPLNYFLPFAPLAPVQCTGWGSHGTTGIPTVDYYVSSRLVEPDGAEDHFTERLVRLEGLTSFQHRVSAPPATRSQFGLSPSGHVYVCPGRLGKLHPESDPLLAALLRADPQGFLVLLAGKDPYPANQLRRRFERTLAGVQDRVVFLPAQSPADYLGLLSVADVFLDAPHYSAGFTGYDAFSLGLPIVTLPDGFGIGRYVQAFYRKLELGDLVSATPEEYVSQAVRLGTDRGYRESVRSLIVQRAGALFEDMEAVREHERFFEEALAGAEAGEKHVLQES